MENPNQQPLPKTRPTCTPMIKDFAITDGPTPGLEEDGVLVRST
jgi:hypothetical protein